MLDRYYVEARLHYDGARGEDIIALQEKLARSQATPLYLIFDPRNERQLAGPLGGITTPDAFREFLLGAREREERVGRLDER